MDVCTSAALNIKMLLSWVHNCYDDFIIDFIHLVTAIMSMSVNKIISY